MVHLLHIIVAGYINVMISKFHLKCLKNTSARLKCSRLFCCTLTALKHSSITFEPSTKATLESEKFVGGYFLYSTLVVVESSESRGPLYYAALNYQDMHIAFSLAYNIPYNCWPHGS